MENNPHKPPHGPTNPEMFTNWDKPKPQTKANMHKTIWRFGKNIQKHRQLWQRFQQIQPKRHRSCPVNGHSYFNSWTKPTPNASRKEQNDLDPKWKGQTNPDIGHPIGPWLHPDEAPHDSLPSIDLDATGTAQTLGLEAMKQALNNHPNSETQPLNSTPYSRGERQMQSFTNTTQYPHHQQGCSSLFDRIKQQHKSFSKTGPDTSQKAQAKPKKKSWPSSWADKVDKKRAHSRSPNRAQTRSPSAPQSSTSTAQTPTKYTGAIPKTPQPSELPAPKWAPLDYEAVNWPPLSPVKNKKTELNESLTTLQIEIRELRSCPEYQSHGSNKYEDSYSGQDGGSTLSEHTKRPTKRWHRTKQSRPSLPQNHQSQTRKRRSSKKWQRILDEKERKWKEIVRRSNVQWKTQNHNFPTWVMGRCQQTTCLPPKTSDTGFTEQIPSFPHGPLNPFQPNNSTKWPTTWPEKLSKESMTPQTLKVSHATQAYYTNQPEQRSQTWHTPPRHQNDWSHDQ